MHVYLERSLTVFNRAYSHAGAYQGDWWWVSSLSVCLGHHMKKVEDHWPCSFSVSCPVKIGIAEANDGVTDTYWVTNAQAQEQANTLERNEKTNSLKA